MLTIAKKSANIIIERKMIYMNLLPRRFDFDDMFDNFFVDKSYSNMKCDVYEKGGNYHIEMDIPGFDKNDISIEVKNDYLIITAEKNNEKNEEDKEKKYIRQERSYGKYQRSFYVGNIDTENVNAEFKNGMLEIIIPMKEKVEDKKMIEIK